MNKFIFFIVLNILFVASCTVNRSGSTTPATISSNNSTQTANAEPKSGEKTTSASVKNNEKAATKAECIQVDTGDKQVLENQTFAFDFAPFDKSCFVTAYNPEYDDPPMEAEFAIYNGGKKVFDFPNQFNGVTFGCWVEAVAFEDLNADNLKDVVVVGKCSAKSAPYNENMVYVNTGKAFTTSEDANYKLSDFTKMKEIIDFVKENKQMYFK